MADRPEFLSALRHADARLRDEHVGASANHRIATRLAEELRPPPTRRWLPALAFAAGALIAVTAAGLRLGSSPSASSTPPPRLEAPTVAGFTVPDPGCAWPGDDPSVPGLRLEGACRATPDHGRLEVQTFAEERAAVSTVPTGVELHTGRALFDVNEAAPDDPVHVRVPGGTIEVFGTKFFVTVDPGGGHVDLIEGKIRFVHADGSVSRVAPGERFGWSLAPVVARAPGTPEPDLVPAEPAPPRPRARRLGPAEVDAVVERVQGLRRDRRYEAAARELRRALRQRLRPRAREVLSYELGDLLDRKLDQPARACAHWRRHLTRFPAGRYTDAIERAVARLGCD